MSLVVISDIHGQTFWKDVVSQVLPDDTVVFLGDYFDRRGDGPFAESQVENFLEICDFAKSHSDTHLLIGNHDFQYTPYVTFGISNYDFRNAESYSDAIMANFDMLNVAYFYDMLEFPVICVHGGICRQFLEFIGIDDVKDINSEFHEHPRKFDFIPKYYNEPANTKGDDPWQTPLWIRPNSVMLDAVSGYAQIVGHTPVQNVTKFDMWNGLPVWCTCTLDENAWMRI